MPQKCRRPLWQRIFFNRSRSSRSFESTLLDRIWLYLPSTISFCLLRNQSGILNCVGFCMMFTMRSSSSELRSPALVKQRENGKISAHYTGRPVGNRGTSPLSQVNIGLFADNVGVATTNTLDLSQ